MRYSRTVTAHCEAGCDATFTIADGETFVNPTYPGKGNDHVAGRYGVVGVNALALTAMKRAGWAAFSHRAADNTFDEYTDETLVHVGRLNRLLLVCPACAPEFLPPLSDSAKREVEQRSEKDQALIDAIGRLETELAVLKAQVAS